MNPKRQRPTGWQAEQGAVSDAGSDDSVANATTSPTIRKLTATLTARMEAPDRGSPSWLVEQMRLLDALAAARDVEAQRRLREVELHRRREHVVADVEHGDHRHVAVRIARPRERRSRPTSQHVSIVAGADGDGGGADDDSAIRRRRSVA